MNTWYDGVKRAFDIVVGGAAWIITLPLQGVVALAVWRIHGRPILFRQPRPGKDGVVFEFVKFRTMLAVDSSHVTDADRLTPLGRFLRSTSLDELPTLLHVISGRMSLVGPRPLLVEYLPRYSERQARRHEVRPGVTGLAQVTGRNGLDWDDKLELDVQYVERRSLGLDLAILGRTIAVVAGRRGVSGVGEATMSTFVGQRAGETA